MGLLQIEIGEKFGNLVVIGTDYRYKTPNGKLLRSVLCECVCGKKIITPIYNLLKKERKSCGCATYIRSKLSNTPIGKIWRCIIRRCSEKHIESHLYYHKGIRVCKEWLSDINLFYDWATKNGYNKGLQIDRIDGNQGYSPENCRWVTPKQNCNNRSVTLMITYKGVTQSLAMLASEKGLDAHIATLRQRLKNNWNHDDIIDKPFRQGNYKRGKRIKNSLAR